MVELYPFDFTSGCVFSWQTGFVSVMSKCAMDIPIVPTKWPANEQQGEGWTLTSKVWDFFRMKTGIGIVKMLERSGNQEDCNVWITFFGCWYSSCHCHGAKDYMGIKPSSVLMCSHKDLMFLIRSKTCVTDQLFHAAGFKFHPIFFAWTSCLLIHVPSWQLTDPIPAGT